MKKKIIKRGIYFVTSFIYLYSTNSFIFTLFTFKLCFRGTNATENQNVVAACKGGTVGVYGAKMRSGYTVDSPVLHTFNDGTKITGTWVTGEYVQGHYSNSKQWLKLHIKG